MGAHRASRRVSRTANGSQTPTKAVPGKRKAVKHAGPRGPLFRNLPSVPVLLGVAALSVSATGAVSAGASDAPDTSDNFRLTAQASALNGVTSVGTSSALDQREQAVSRDSRREALADATSEKLQEAAEAAAEERNAELAKLAQSAQRFAAQINVWQLPLSVGYRLSARFGESSSLWSSVHTGLDFAASYGAPVLSVTSGVVTSVGYEGSYGNQVVVTSEDGEEFWYCHLSGYAVSVGDTVRAGDTLGYVGSTGNSTGSHLHLEVRPGAGDPVDPYAALVAHGVQP